jgi:hypothetical protein
VFVQFVGPDPALKSRVVSGTTGAPNRNFRSHPFFQSSSLFRSTNLRHRSIPSIQARSTTTARQPPPALHRRLAHQQPAPTAPRAAPTASSHHAQITRTPQPPPAHRTQATSGPRPAQLLPLRPARHHPLAWPTPRRNYLRSQRSIPTQTARPRSLANAPAAHAPGPTSHARQPSRPHLPLRSPRCSFRCKQAKPPQRQLLHSRTRETRPNLLNPFDSLADRSSFSSVDFQNHQKIHRPELPAIGSGTSAQAVLPPLFRPTSGNTSFSSQ